MLPQWLSERQSGETVAERMQATHRLPEHFKFESGRSQALTSMVRLQAILGCTNRNKKQLIWKVLALSTVGCTPGYIMRFECLPNLPMWARTHLELVGCHRQRLNRQRGFWNRTPHNSQAMKFGWGKALLCCIPNLWIPENNLIQKCRERDFFFFLFFLPPHSASSSLLYYGMGNFPVCFFFLFTFKFCPLVF